MTLMTRLILILFGLAYLISPVDIIPDLAVPFAGWIDDGLVLWCIYYLLRYGDLPWFLFKGRKKQSPRPKQQQPRPRTNAPGSGGPRKSASPDTGKADTRQRRTQAPPKKESPPSPATVLGIDENASWEEIQAAYREKIKQYHPDKLSHLGEEFSSLANEKFLEIQAAYTALKSRHKKA